jgi:hypothetical protein
MIDEHMRDMIELEKSGELNCIEQVCDDCEWVDLKKCHHNPAMCLESAKKEFEVNHGSRLDT